MMMITFSSVTSLPPTSYTHTALISSFFLTFVEEVFDTRLEGESCYNMKEKAEKKGKESKIRTRGERERERERDMKGDTPNQKKRIQVNPKDL
jgi:hypothetical protein